MSKKAIKTAYAADHSIKALLLFGHVPVPYSGNLLADGHPIGRSVYKIRITARPMTDKLLLSRGQ